MKLSELVDFKTQLEQMQVSKTRRQAELELGESKWLVHDRDLQIKDYAQQLESKFHQVHQSLDQYQQVLDNLLSDVKDMIETAEKPWFAESYRLYEEEMCHETVEYILNRRPELDQDTRMMLKSRLQNYSSWKYPGMIVRPGNEDFIEDLVSFDPLYLVDDRYDLLLPAIDRFNVEYQRRLRPYVIQEISDEEILSKIPNGQFGICLVYNLFEFRPLEIIKKYLIEIYSKLRPGGILIFTFNDCDNSKAVKLVEQSFCCYTPGGLIRELTSALGYEQVFFWNNNGPTSWLEIRKPGELTSLRGGQTLAKINHK